MELVLLVRAMLQGMVTFHIASHDQVSQLVDSIGVLCVQYGSEHCVVSNAHAKSWHSTTVQRPGTHHDVALTVLLDSHPNQLLKHLQRERIITHGESTSLRGVNKQVIVI